MSKLRRVKDNWNRNCRWCHYYVHGKCTLNKRESITPQSVTEFVEAGYLDEVIEESLDNVSSIDFIELEDLLRAFKLSGKKIKEIRDLFHKRMQYFKQYTLRPELESSISKCLYNHLDTFGCEEGIEISDPENFCCKEWC